MPYIDWTAGIFQSAMQWEGVVWMVLWFLTFGLKSWTATRRTKRLVKRIAEASEEERKCIFAQYGVGVKEGRVEKGEGEEV
jgi:hypothetical protein